MALSRRTRHCLVLLLVSLALLPLGMATDPIGGYCSESGTSDAEINGKTRRRSINSVVSDLVAKAASNGGFATSSAGKGNNVFYGLAQCRGDVSASDCKACLVEAANYTLSFCHYASDSRMWYDYCFMRYKNANFIGQVDTRVDASVRIRKEENMDNPKTFQKAVAKTMDKAIAQAVATAGSAALGRVKKKYMTFVNIYGLSQCTRDLAPLACAQCLSTAVSNFGDICNAAEGCQIEYNTCWVRYEIYPFYFPLKTDGRATTDMTKYTKVVVH
ncbi:cysteine-rich repeat secretory protein 55-like [Oryza glaberrima]|uniref:Gnk2-homologous domain-containing protein n=1 Tax=Oryza barthii TaxID=65489 RepID=A0A0D3FHP3_9ORYZ|nr:cysteine-rich repeat secretory protein 55-like [Oryza glaberrima]